MELNSTFFHKHELLFQQYAINNHFMQLCISIAILHTFLTPRTLNWGPDSPMRLRWPRRTDTPRGGQLSPEYPGGQYAWNGGSTSSGIFTILEFNSKIVRNGVRFW